MKLKIEYIGFQKENKTIEVEKGKTYSKLMEELGINPETVVIIKDGMPVPIDDYIEEGEVKIIRVISGG